MCRNTRFGCPWRKYRAGIFGDRGPENNLGHNSLMQTAISGIDFELLSASAFASAQDDLVNLLRSCVHGGASLGFLAPLPDSEAVDYWSAIAPQIQSGRPVVLVAREETRRPVVRGG